MGRSVHIRENKILFIGGLTGTHTAGKGDDMLTGCLILTYTNITEQLPIYYVNFHMNFHIYCECSS